jgi:four helix bundle protein
MTAPVFQSFKDLVVWQKSMDLAEASYRLATEFPKDEMYGMTAQIRRAAVSIAANIAEGHGRESTGSFVQFLRMAQGSLKELETHLLLAGRVHIIRTEKIAPLLADCETIGKMLRSLIRSLQSKIDSREAEPRSS